MSGNGEQPNVVMVTWDSVRADHLPIYGYDRNTCPCLSERAADGLVFENTHVPAVGTSASFSGIFSGEHASGTMENPNPGHWRSSLEGTTLLPEVLQEAGYYTGGFHVNALMSSPFGWNRGWDVYSDGMWDKDPGESEEDDGGVDLRKFVYDQLQKVDMANFAVHFKKLLTGEEPHAWEELWPSIAEFVSDAPEPWFLWVLLIDTHHPYCAPPEYHEWDQPGVRSTYVYNYVMRRRRDWVGERNQSIVNAYDNALRYADRFVERLSSTIRNEGYGDVPFIFHSDHGDEMGEHANYGHRPLMYNTVTKVPLVMWNVGETGRREGPHTLLDLGNAVLDVAGGSERLGEGKSLLSDQRDVVTIQNLLGEHGRCAAAVGDRWKVLYHPEGDWGHGGYVDPGFEAYDIREDPMEKDDRYGEHPEEVEAALEEQLQSKTGVVGEDAEGVAGDLQERLSELGYLK